MSIATVRQLELDEMPVAAEADVKSGLPQVDRPGRRGCPSSSFIKNDKGRYQS